MDVKLDKYQVCDSKQKLTQIAAQYLVTHTNKGLSQDYYLCEICESYHLTSVYPKVTQRRSTTMFQKDTKDVHYAKKAKKKRRK